MKNCDGEGRLWAMKNGKQECMSCRGCDACCPTWIEKIALVIENDKAEGMPMDAIGPQGSPGEEWLLASRCIKLVRDIAKWGIRFDLMPTISVSPNGPFKSESAFYYDYLKRIDESQKKRAADAMSGEVERGVAIFKGMAVGIDMASGKDYSVGPCMGCRKGLMEFDCPHCHSYFCLPCYTLHKQKDCLGELNGRA